MNMILHHYHISPFSEKIRLMFGHSNIDWRSTIVSPLPPRRLLDSLTGGYRRIPVLQVGADLFCDSRIICDEVATASQRPELGYSSCGKITRDYVDHVDSKVFMAVAQSTHAKTALLTMLKHHWPWQIARLIVDRANIVRTSSLPRHTRQERIDFIDQFKQDLEQRLFGKPFLFGGEACLADFSAYHTSWFADQTRPGDFLEGHPKATAWYRRMCSFGHGRFDKINRKQRRQQVQQNTPREVDETLRQHDWIGQQVRISPDDYAKAAATGILVGANEWRWIIERKHPTLGKVHVHFPVSGFTVKCID